MIARLVFALKKRRNKTMRTRFFALLIAALMVLSFCPVFAEEATETITFWCAYKGVYGMDDLIAAFEELHPEINVELMYANNSTDGNLAVDTALMAGGEIDVLLSYTTDRTEERASSGFFADLTDLIAAEGWDMMENWGCDVKFTEDQRYYGIPVDGLVWYVAINMTEWENAGLGEIPTAWTWDEYLAASKAMTREGMFGGSNTQETANTMIYQVRQQLGADVLYNEDGYSALIDNPMFRKAFDRMYQAEVVDKIWFPLTEYRANGLQTQNTFLTKQVAMTVCANMWRFISNTEEYPIDFKVAFAPYPTEEPGQTNYMSGPSPYGFATIAADTEHFDACWEFVKFFATEGNKYMLKTGHLPTYSGTDIDGAISYIFGSEEAAAELIDIDTFKKVVFNYGGPNYVDTILNGGGSTGLSAILLSMLSDEITADEGFEQAVEEINLAIDEM